MPGRVVIHPEVEQAVQLQRPIVALESAVITTGLPREPLAKPLCRPEGWRDDQPMNLEVALMLQRLVRDWNAVPATVALIDGVLHIGLEEEQIRRLAEDVTEKASVSTLATLMARRASAGTTVSATLAACRLTPSPIQTFATGGIGGVHRQWASRPDISADLREIANTPTCVVCAGAKSVLDVPATVEALEALGVPLLGYATDYLPQFQSLGSASVPVSQRVDDVALIARTCVTQWQALRRGAGVILANPVPSEFAVDASELEVATVQAEQSAVKSGVAGASRTPHVLREVAQLTEGRSLQANIALLASNAALAGELAVAIASFQDD